MFSNFNEVDFFIFAVLCLTNIICIAGIIYLTRKNRKQSILLAEYDAVKVTKIGEEEKAESFEEIIEAMQKDLEEEKEKNENPVEVFEREQEENAIISYQELLNFKAKNEKVETISEEQEGVEDLQIEQEKIEEPKQDEKKTKFTNSEFVSPVFGTMKPNNNTNITIEEEKQNSNLEKTLNMEPLTEEIKKNSEFLNALKDFRKNL